jgi:hypothetical protein
MWAGFVVSHIAPEVNDPTRAHSLLDKLTLKDDAGVDEIAKVPF